MLIQPILPFALLILPSGIVVTSSEKSQHQIEHEPWKFLEQDYTI